VGVEEFGSGATKKVMSEDYCSQCHLMVMKPNVGYGVNPDAVCKCPGIKIGVSPPYLGIYQSDYERGWNDALEFAAQEVDAYLQDVEGSNLGADDKILSLRIKRN
jgi:hypothetical protein